MNSPRLFCYVCGYLHLNVKRSPFHSCFKRVMKLISNSSEIPRQTVSAFSMFYKVLVLYKYLMGWHKHTINTCPLVCVSMKWCELKNCIDNCFSRLTTVKGFTKKSKHSASYANISSASIALQTFSSIPVQVRLADFFLYNLSSK